MKHKLITLLLITTATIQTHAQADATPSYRNFPLVITVQFHALSMPFQRMLSNFRNPGIGIGTEFSLNGKHNWAQQLTAMWYCNRAVGNGLLLYTQAAWRPSIGSYAYTEFKLGVGYEYSFRPSASFKNIDGKWISARHSGKGMLALPLGVSMGYDQNPNDTYASPFASYQLLILKGYSSSVPIVPQTLIQVGSRIHMR